MGRLLLAATVAVACAAQTLAQSAPSCLAFPGTGGPSLPKTCISHGGLDRCWLTYTPTALVNRTEKAAAVMLLHGLSACADFIGLQTGMIVEAEQRGFYLVIPQGTFNLNQAMPAGQEFLANVSSWNADRCCGAAVVRQIDDSGFLAKVVDNVTATLPVNQKRFYVYGHSNGAAMAARFAVEHSDKVTAVAAVSFYLIAQVNAYTSKVPYFAVHGESDETVPFGSSVLFGAGVVAATGNFAAINGCTKGPLSQSLTVSGKPYTRISYGGCDAPRNSEVVLAVVPKGTHQPFPDAPPLNAFIKFDNFTSGKIACDFLFDYERVANGTSSASVRTALVSPSPNYDAPVTPAPVTSAPSTLAPSTRAPSTRAPSTAEQLLPSLATLALTSWMLIF